MRILRLVTALLLLLVLSACDDDTPSSTPGFPTPTFTARYTPPPQATPAVGTVAYDDKLCERVYTANGIWEYYKIDGLTYCYKQIGATTYDAYRWIDLTGNNWNYAVLKPVFRRDFSVGQGTMQLMMYSDNLWRRVQVASGAVEVYYNNQWVVYSDYTALEQARLARESQATQQAEAAARQRSLTEYYKIQERMIKMAEPFLAPACNSSYNGCD